MNAIRVPFFVASCALATLALMPHAHAQEEVRVGVFLPSAPFPNTGARLGFANQLAEHLAQEFGSTSSSGRTYARASDFANAARRGKIDFGVVDATYLASARGRYQVLAVAVRNGSSEIAWQLVATDAVNGVMDLKDKVVIVPRMGGRELAFAVNFALGGEVPRDFFDKVRVAPDAVSAVTSVGLGRADAAFVPRTTQLPAGVSQLVELPRVSWPVLVAVGRVDAAMAKRVASAARSFTGGGFNGFEPVSANVYQSLAREMRNVNRFGYLVLPPIDFATKPLLREQKLSIERPGLADYITAPVPKGRQATSRR